MRNKTSYFERSFDIDWMLYDTAIWLTEQTGRPVEDFVEIAIAIDIRQEDWDTFWKKFRERERRKEVKLHHHIVDGKCVRCGSVFGECFHNKCKSKKVEKEGEIEAIIGDKEYRFTEEEFEVAKQILKEAHPEEMSNCCGAEVYAHRGDDHTSRCKHCKEGCGILYIF